jgi:hypothetical protein
MREVHGQTPCYEGALDRRLFEGHFAEVPRGILARVQADGRLALEGGTLLGLARGCELRIEDASQKPVGLALVEEAWLTHARASWSGSAPAGVPAVLRAFEQSRPGGGPSFALWVEDAELAAALPAHPDVLRSAAPAPEAYLLRRSGEALTLLAPGGIPIWRDSAGAKLSPAELGRELSETWRKETRHQLLEELGPGTLRLEASFRPPTEKELAQAAAGRANVRVHSVGVERAPGVAGAVYEARGRTEGSPELALAVLVVRNHSQQELTLAVLSVMESRDIRVVCPAGRGDEILLPAGEEHAVLVDVTCGDNWPLERPQRDRYVVIARRGPLDPWSFESSATTRGAEGPAHLPAILRAGLEPRATRGSSKRVRVDDEPFGATTVDLYVRGP